jgi:hypothetical protein
MKSRIRDRMSDIQQEVRAWLCGWGPPLDKAQARKLIAEVQGIRKNILSPPHSGECGNFTVSLDIVMLTGFKARVSFCSNYRIYQDCFCYTVESLFTVP